MLPGAADAASLTDQVKKRLCDRQDRLAGRLVRALISPALCKGEPEPDPEPTLDFTAEPDSIEEGESSTLSWSTTDATSCTASGGWSGGKSTSGTQSVTPSEDTTYTLTCSGDGGSVSESVTVTVDEGEPLPEPTLEFDADPTEVAPNGTSTLAWDSTDATACVASGGWSGMKSLDGSQVVTVNATTTYTLACGNGMSTTTESVTVDVTEEPEPEPTVEITADPETIDEGATTTLAWESENADSCEASNGWSGEKDTDGSQEVSPSVTTTYAIECEGPGGIAQDSVTVTVDEAEEAPEVNLSADPDEVTPGEGSATSTLTWTTSDADICVATGGWSGTKALNGSQIVEPDATTTYTLECGNEAGTTTDSVTVDFVPEEEPEPTLDHLVISEVYYDVSSTTSGSEASNEWVEIYNGTDSAVDLQGWFIGDAVGVDEIDASFVVEPDSFAVIVASTTPTGIPDGVPVFVLFSSIGSNGFTNTGDAARLLDASEAVVDQIGYGSNATVSPNVDIPTTTDGHSIARTQLTSDTDTSADWADTSLPDPGQ